MIRQRFAERLSARSGRRTSGGSLENPAAFNGDPSVSSDEEEGQNRSGGGAEKKPWQRANREVYEEQLEKMQEQLINTMLENQALQGTRWDSCGRFLFLASPAPFFSSSFFSSHSYLLLLLLLLLLLHFCLPFLLRHLLLLFLQLSWMTERRSRRRHEVCRKNWTS